jgi:hypothetical protein
LVTSLLLFGLGYGSNSDDDDMEKRNKNLILCAWVIFTISMISFIATLIKFCINFTTEKAEYNNVNVEEIEIYKLNV